MNLLPFAHFQINFKKGQKRLFDYAGLTSHARWRVLFPSHPRPQGYPVLLNVMDWRLWGRGWFPSCVPFPKQKGNISRICPRALRRHWQCLRVLEFYTGQSLLIFLKSSVASSSIDATALNKSPLHEFPGESFRIWNKHSRMLEEWSKIVRYKPEPRHYVKFCMMKNASRLCKALINPQPSSFTVFWAGLFKLSDLYNFESSLIANTCSQWSWTLNFE